MPGVRGEDGAARYTRYTRALAGEPLPCAFVDLDAIDANVDALVAPLVAAGKRLRIATKSLRCPELVDYIAARAKHVTLGLMTYTAAETAFLAARGARDLLLAYPTVHRTDLRAMIEANAVACAALVVDHVDHVAAIADAAAQASVTVPVVIDLDLAYRPLGARVHLGVRRSPVRSVEQVLALADAIAARPSLRLHGVLGYEAQIAGLPDATPGARVVNAVKRAIKARSKPHVLATRRACVEALAARGLALAVVNGGGSGSAAWSASDPALTEITVGSGFVASGLFDDYADLSLTPAAGFALQITRHPGGDIYTCHGGGYIASGPAGADRLPKPWLPSGFELLAAEGAGEVQTPIRAAMPLQIGQPVLLRHAKAGELAEHFAEYALVRGDAIVARAKTYRGLGHCFLG
jgi:D-serine deaminase-like pyridoxal phosphate-dependent protein